MKPSKSALFLIELIIALLFFSLASTVCIRLFVKSHTLTEHTRNLNYAVTQAQNLAEAFLGLDGNMEQLHILYGGSRLSNNNSLLTVNDNNYYSTLQKTHQLCDCINPIGSTVTADIAVYQTDSDIPIYTLHVDHYIAERLVTHE